MCSSDLDEEIAQFIDQHAGIELEAQVLHLGRHRLLERVNAACEQAEFFVLELSIDREQRATEGQAFLQECFSEFNAALEQANPIEKKISNFLAFTQPPIKEKGSIFDLVPGMSPRKSSFDEFSSASSTGNLRRLGEPRAKTLWGLLGTAQRVAGSHHGSESPPDLNGSIPEEVPSIEQDELRPIRGSLV